MAYVKTLGASLLTAVLLAGVPAHAQQGLALDGKIPLGRVNGRIDHMAVDLNRQRLFVAELGNDTLGVVDLRTNQVLKHIPGLNEVQGVAYFAATDTVLAASGGDGALHVFSGDDLKPGAKIALGRDPDNVRIDTSAGRIYVGYGRGALGVIDGTTLKKVADMPLPGHPESFQLSPANKRIFVNVPSARQIAVID